MQPGEIKNEMNIHVGSDLDLVLTFFHTGHNPFVGNDFHREVKSNPANAIPYLAKHQKLKEKYKGKPITFGIVTNNINLATPRMALTALGEKEKQRIVAGYLSSAGDLKFHLNSEQVNKEIEENRATWGDKCILDLRKMLDDLKFNIDLEKIVECWQKKYPEDDIGKNLHIIIQALEWNADHPGKTLTDFILIDDTESNIEAAKKLHDFLQDCPKELNLSKLKNLKVHTIQVQAKLVDKETGRHEIGDYFPEYEKLMESLLAGPKQAHAVVETKVESAPTEFQPLPNMSVLASSQAVSAPGGVLLSRDSTTTGSPEALQSEREDDIFGGLTRPPNLGCW